MSLLPIKPGSECESGVAPASETHSLHLDSERFRLLVENSQDLVVEVSHLGEVLYVSPNVRTVLGFAPDEVLGGSLFSRVHPQDLAHVQEQFAIHAGRATGRHQHKDGSWRWMETSGREFTTSQGDTRRVLIARDITGQRQAEAQRDRLQTELARMEKLTALGTLAGGIAHDFNNLLTVIVAYADIARAQSGQPDVIASLDQIAKATDRAKQLTGQIFAFSQQHQHERQPVVLSPIVHDALKLMRPTIPSHVEVEMDLHEDAGKVLVDSTQIYQVIVNLCTNALHAIGSSPGRLSVELTRTEVESGSDLLGDDLAPGAYVCLAVTDNGDGMDEATQRRVFEPFFTTKPPGEGTGLGLAIVRRIVQEHKAAIRLESQPGAGTTFRIFFPIVGETGTRSGDGARILFVDGDPAASRTFQHILEESNHLVRVQANASAALADFNEHGYDLVVVALKLPDGSGIDFALKVLETAPGTPVLLTSDDFGTWTPQGINLRGVCGVLAKPFTTEAVLRSVRTAIRNRCPTRSACEIAGPSQS
jgi:PAS domain S-box-containing protein